MSKTTTPAPVLKSGAVYFSDNGRTICRECAGMSALYSGRDISGQRVKRATVADCAEWEAIDPQYGDALGPLNCESGCTTLSPIAGPDGWPMVKS